MSATINATEPLQNAYDLFNLSAFDTNGALSSYLLESWSAGTYDPSKASSTVAFSSSLGSKLTNKFSISDTSNSESIDLKAADKSSLKTSHSDTTKESSSSFTETIKDSLNYKEGADTKDKTDDITLSTSFSSQYKETDTSTSSSNTASVSYVDGHTNKFSFKSTQKIVETTVTTTVSDMSYSDAEGHVFKFSGSFIDDGDTTTLKIKSLTITSDGTTMKLGASTLTDSSYDYGDLFAVNTTEGSLGVDFNGDTSGDGLVTNFFDTYSTAWIAIYTSLHG